MKQITILIISFLVLLAFPESSSAETIEGSVMMWETEELLNGSIIKIYRDSELVSQCLSKDGRYRADVLPGRYNITAIYIDPSGAVYVEEEAILIKSNTTLDFIMLVPKLDLSDEDYDISEISEIEDVLSQVDISDSGKSTGIPPEIFNYVAVFILIGTASVIAFIFLRKREKRKAFELTEGMRNVIGTLGENESRIVLLLAKHEGSLRRTELARGTEISKSSLSVALSRLERKNIVRIDRTFVTHEVMLTEWFKSL